MSTLVERTRRDDGYTVEILACDLNAAEPEWGWRVLDPDREEIGAGWGFSSDDCAEAIYVPAEAAVCRDKADRQYRRQAFCADILASVRRDERRDDDIGSLGGQR